MTRRTTSWADQFQQRLAATKYVNPYQFFGWFLALALPWVVAMNVFIGWHNSVVEQVHPWHLALRLAIGLAGGLPIIFVTYWKALRPAIRKAEQDAAAREET